MNCLLTENRSGGAGGRAVVSSMTPYLLLLTRQLPRLRWPERAFFSLPVRVCPFRPSSFEVRFRNSRLLVVVLVLECVFSLALLLRLLPCLRNQFLKA